MNLNKISKKVLTRLGLVVLMLTILGGVLTSCGGNSYRATVTKNQEITVADGDTTHGLSATQLNEIADKIIKADAPTTVREQLVAALNGYNMNAENFDDSKVGGELQPQPEKTPEFAITALKKGGIETFSYVNNDGTPIMTTADVQSIVDALRSTVETEGKMGLLDRLLHWLALGFEWMINTLGFGNFTLGTVWFAIAVEILMLPLGIHQQKNSRKQARLRPKEMAIRAKYKGRDDQATRQKLTMEIQQMYQAEGYSPMAGCLPMLISLPFLFALYYIVIDPLHYMMGCSAEVGTALISYVGASRAAGGLGMSLSANTRGTIEVLSAIRESGLDLSGIADFAFFKNGAECLEVLEPIVARIPNFTLFGLNLGINPGFHKPYLLLLIPVLTFVVYFASMKLNRKLTFQPVAGQNDPAQGCSNTIMDVSMPLMSAWFAFQVPAAIGLYWMFKSIISTIKQFIVAKVMPLPKFTEEDYKAAERELMGKEKNKPVKKSELPTGSTGGRSLHHIDDEEDYSATRKGEGGESMHHIDDGAELQPTPPAHNGSKKKKKSHPTEDAPAEDAPVEETESTEPAEPAEPADLPEKNGAVNIAPLKEDRHNNDCRPEDRG